MRQTACAHPKSSFVEDGLLEGWSGVAEFLGARALEHGVPVEEDAGGLVEAAVAEEHGVLGDHYEEVAGVHYVLLADWV